MPLESGLPVPCASSESHNQASAGDLTFVPSIRPRSKTAAAV